MNKVNFALPFLCVQLVQNVVVTQFFLQPHYNTIDSFFYCELLSYDALGNICSLTGL